MVHGLFYGVLLAGFFGGLFVQWYYRAYLDLLLTVHSIEVLFLGIVGWYSFGPLVLGPLLALWLTGLGAIYVMNRFA
ncbi:hypothetical protein D1831_02165 [Lactiplantibacillus garii]|uniref:Integral membrane protein n=1 Tax=Lactiplantibacillus garii TaxID=2306423 RepID=A0A426DA96_9LACO|nr:hypothetical protein [Lactiplantibacillus garii]RRK11517.1 hypothetical protein D1831_02165 [Lactiplantibacillus garii]